MPSTAPSLASARALTAPRCSPQEYTAAAGGDANSVSVEAQGWLSEED